MLNHFHDFPQWIIIFPFNNGFCFIISSFWFILFLPPQFPQVVYIFEDILPSLPNLLRWFIYLKTPYPPSPTSSGGLYSWRHLTLPPQPSQVVYILEDTLPSLPNLLRWFMHPSICINLKVWLALNNANTNLLLNTLIIHNT